MAAMAGASATLVAARAATLEASFITGTRSPFPAGRATALAQSPVPRARSSLQSARRAAGARASIAEGRTAGSESSRASIDPQEGLQSRNEEFVRLVEGAEQELQALRDRAQGKREILASLQTQIDSLYEATFSGVCLPAEEGQDAGEQCFGPVDEKLWGDLGRSQPLVLKQLIGAVDKGKWMGFQAEFHTLVLQRDRTRQEVEALEAQLVEAEALLAEPAGEADWEPSDGTPGVATGRSGVFEVVLIAGFESFNVALYRQAAAAIRAQCPGINVTVFSDRDIFARSSEVAAALAKAQVFFGSLIFDYDECEWLQKRVGSIPIRLVFESSLELMATTALGSFTMAGGKSKGMPGPIKAVLSKFGGGKEEDKMVGYLSFLKIGPKLLRFIPGQKVRDLRNWLTVYGYWNQGGLENVTSMFLYLAKEYLVPRGGAGGAPGTGSVGAEAEAGAVVSSLQGLQVPPARETPPLGLYHPDHAGYFLSAPAYLKWHRATRKLPAYAPVVALLLYRKHVITGQRYIPMMIRMFEDAGLLPVPFFINGVEAHTVVRDLLTSHFEQDQRRLGIVSTPSLKSDAVPVDAVVSTIGFPLVGGPAGTMEGGRQAEVAKSILEAKDIPYVVSGPLLIQDIASWRRSGVQGLQSVVLYSLPELDGAIDTVPLGGLVGDGIHLVPERVRRLTSRIKSWVRLRRTPAAERKVAIVLYGFPPGVGATGTAALLNVPRSLEKMLCRLQAEGYDLGGSAEAIDGDALLGLLRELDQEQAVGLGERGAPGAVAAARAKWEAAQESEGGEGGEGGKEGGSAEWLPEAVARAECVDWRTLRGWLGDTLTGRMEKAWGELRRYRGIRCDAEGRSVVSGVQLGNVWIGVQPLLGLEGDPMRLLFERDLTPHPQYAAFYKWLQNSFRADAVVHFGMHGTVEWLPGSPLGNTGLSWSDVLLGALPNIYLYAANNPSESIVAKRRGYGTIVSYNVPPYGRAGLYKELASLRELIAEFREDPVKNAGLREAIVGALAVSGIQADVHFRRGEAQLGRGHAQGGAGSQETPAGSPEEGLLDLEGGLLGLEVVVLDEDNVGAVDLADFEHYVYRVSEYLGVLENRLFSEGLHCLGTPPSPAQAKQYLSAYFGEDLPEAAVDAVVAAQGGLPEVRRRLEEAYLEAGEGLAPGRRTGGDAQAQAQDMRVEEALRIRDLLGQNTEELESLVRGLGGHYIPPAVGGDLLRDGPGVLPTGRNIHALDPYRMPSAAAWERGSAIAAALVAKHRAETGAFPETVGVMLWGLDAIKTRGESVAIALALVGARPVKEGTGRVVRFELVPLAELGRPRIDVLANMSGIFRDSFANVVDLLDDLFQRAAAAEEPPELNYIRKHARELEGAGVAAPAARLFSNPAGDYGSMVNERVGAADWEGGAELGDTWRSRNAFSYGRGGERGVARPEVMQQLLRTTQHIVQEIDSVEYGLTDIQEYYANTGAMKKAAETAQGGKRVACSVVETYGKDIKPRDLEATLRMEYRTKLLNPKWAEKMAEQGSGGAYEISQRMTALVGWGGTAGFEEDWVYDQAAATYALDDAMSAKLRKSNPEAFRNILKRMLEAAGRGMWKADPETLRKLQDAFGEMDDELEGVNLKR